MSELRSVGAVLSAMVGVLVIGIERGWAGGELIGELGIAGFGELVPLPEAMSEAAWDVAP